MLWKREKEKQTLNSFVPSVLVCGFSFYLVEFINGLQDACQVKRFAGFSKTGCPPGKNCTFSLCEKVTLFGVVRSVYDILKPYRRVSIHNLNILSAAQNIC